ncbi:lipocalin family protein [Mucilaginibacter myungsuensis]|uniref:Lipocalin family protein n=1 Tax=Mucilaginibacter myungsuensis TaxID=649104 RepID=A0A929PWJ7_9SPHI|nr:lipocalin family protein [Mucilaginibacter myungsuensis]MBE9661430.1 lipocalin family protein [Mucilaginibacter myungsuensis]MDN3597573.1 lipocalin family protein [Mucilaginibacter myungsuensis]
MRRERLFYALAAAAGAAAVTYKLMSRDIPKGATVVEPFHKMRYLGLWHEIARMPSWIEENLTHVTEDYSLNDDGTIEVVTRAYHTQKERMISATGHIKFAGPEDEGMLRVSYFKPVYFAYNVLDVDQDYKYALVSTSNLDYLWILSREKSVPYDINRRFLSKALEIGFDISKLEWMAW